MKKGAFFVLILSVLFWLFYLWVSALTVGSSKSINNINSEGKKIMDYHVTSDGEITIKPLNPWIAYGAIKDQYWQTATFRVRVNDVTLELARYEITLAPWTEEIVYILEYYQDIKTILKNNAKALVYLEEDEQWKYLRIKWVEQWQTIIQIEDNEGNIKTMRITIWWWSSQQPVEPPTESEEESGNAVENGWNTYIDGVDVDSVLEEILNQLENEQNAIQINSAPTASRCELWNTGKFWVRPYNATCLDQQTHHAWTCKPWYRDLYNIDGTNTCVSREFYDDYYQYSKHALSVLKTKIHEAAQKIPESSIEKFLESIDSLQIRKVESTQYPIMKWIYNYILDELRNELDKRIDEQHKQYEDIRYFHRAFRAASNNGLYMDSTISEYKWKTRTEIEQYAQRFAEKLINYKLVYNPTFKANHDVEVNTLVSQWVPLEEALRWVKDWLIEWTKDYVMAYYDLWASLWNVSFKDIFNGINHVWEVMKTPIESTKSLLSWFQETIEWIYNKVWTLAWYDLAKWTSYVWTNVTLSSIDPAWRILAAAGGRLFVRVEGKVDVISRGYVLSNISNISTKIGSGHALTKHINEFKKFWIHSVDDLIWNTSRIIKKFDWTLNMKVWKNGRIAYWDDIQESIVIYDPKNIDLGTTFVPTEGKVYFNNFK
jgi:hypothetical protein